MHYFSYLKKVLRRQNLALLLHGLLHSPGSIHRPLQRRSGSVSSCFLLPFFGNSRPKFQCWKMERGLVFSKMAETLWQTHQCAAAWFGTLEEFQNVRNSLEASRPFAYSLEGRGRLIETNQTPLMSAQHSILFGNV